MPSLPTEEPAELESLPLSTELLEYYRQRVQNAENELKNCNQRLDQIDQRQLDLHKSRWGLQKRNQDVGDLQRALSDSHVIVWEEKEKNRKLQAENDQLRMNEAEDRRKIQHLLALVDPITQEVTYSRSQAPDTLNLHSHARSNLDAAQSDQQPRKGVVARKGITPEARRAGGPSASAASDKAPVVKQPPTARVLRTVYMPNEKVETLQVHIESLRAQLQEQEELSRERTAALLEDRRLRIAEESARRSAEAEQMRELDEALKKSEGLLHRATRDYLTLKHETLEQQRMDTERIQVLRVERDSLAQNLEQLRKNAAIEVEAASAGAKRGAEQYVTLFRQQVADTERTLGLLKDQHHGLQQALAMRVKELEENLSSLKTKYRALEQRRKLDSEGYQQELSMVQKQLSRIEVRVYGHQARERVTPREPQQARRRKVDINALRGRLEALERATVA